VVHEAVARAERGKSVLASEERADSEERRRAPQKEKEEGEEDTGRGAGKSEEKTE
jgi:hypothetical protein